MAHPADVLRIAAAIDYLHGEFKLSECPQITGDMWSEAFRCAGSEPNFYEGGVDVGITENLLYRAPLLAFAEEQFNQLTIAQWELLGIGPLKG